MRNSFPILFLFNMMILISSSGCKKKIPSTPDVLIPESTYTKAKTILKVSATDPNKDRIYYIADWNDGIIDTFPETGQAPYNSGDTVLISHIYEKWSPPRVPEYKNFEIKVTAKDEKGNIQNIWSQPETIKVIYNEEPNRPTMILNHEMGGINTFQGFRATATDPEGDSITFQFSFFESDQWTEFIKSGDTIEVFNNRWFNIETVGIWVITKDIKGSISIPSETLKFKVIDEGYIKGVFHATTRPDEGEVDTFEMLSSPAIATMAGNEYIFIGSEAWYAFIIDVINMYKVHSIDPTDVRCYCQSAWGNTPAVDIQNSRWYIANDDWGFFALGTNGTRIWVYPTIPHNHSDYNYTDAAFNGNYVCVATKDTLYCLNSSTGIKIWGYSIPSIDIKTAPIIDVQGDIYIGDDSGYIRKINGTTGELKWKIDLGSNVPTSGAIDNITGIIYFGVNDGSNSNLCALEPDSGTLHWSYQIDEKIINSPTIGTDGFIYIGDEQGKIYAVKDGIIKSGFPISIEVGGVNATLSTPAFAADGYFYVMTEEQFIFCIGVDGNIRWETPLPTAGLEKSRKLKREEHVPSPVIGSDGDIYVASGFDIGLYRIMGRSSGTPANTPWPMFRHDRNHSAKAGFVPSR